MVTKRVTKKTAAPRKAAIKKTIRTPRKKAEPIVQEDLHAWNTAIQAAESKKAENIRVLDLRPVTTFADYLIVCHGSNPKQNQAIADEVEQQLKKIGERPNSVEGYSNAEWILLDYGDFVVNVFSLKAREYYDLERLWRDAPEVTPKAAG